MKRTLLIVAGNKVFQEGNVISFDAGMTIDADGSPRAYHPDDSKGLDYLANAGRPGNWWGIATDQKGKPVIQGADDSAPGFYVSTTAYFHKQYGVTDPRRYLDSEKVPFVVVPAQLRKMVRRVVLGCLATATNMFTGKRVEAVVGDLGPTTHLGEGSIALAKALGIPSNARRGGVASGIHYRIYPGLTAPGFELIPA